MKTIWEMMTEAVKEEVATQYTKAYTKKLRQTTLEEFSEIHVMGNSSLYTDEDGMYLVLDKNSGNIEGFISVSEGFYWEITKDGDNELLMVSGYKQVLVYSLTNRRCLFREYTR